MLMGDTRRVAERTDADGRYANAQRCRARGKCERYDGDAE